MSEYAEHRIFAPTRHENIQEGDHVVTPSGAVHWLVRRIHSKVDPLGVELVSGMTGRVRFDNYADLILFKKKTEVLA